VFGGATKAMRPITTTMKMISKINILLLRVKSESSKEKKGLLDLGCLNKNIDAEKIINSQNDNIALNVIRLNRLRISVETTTKSPQVVDANKKAVLKQGFLLENNSFR